MAKANKADLSTNAPGTQASEGIAQCRKDQSGCVLSQNETCQKICGDQVGKTCQDNCMSLYDADNPRNSLGTHRFANSDINGTHCDVLMINDGEHITTYLYELAQKKSQDLEFFKQFSLTNRELEIVEHILDGKKNKSIAAELFISPKTLKTHINHILRKVPKDLLKR